MYWRLSDTVTVCVASNRILFLDVARDKYFALPDAHKEPFLEWLAEPLGAKLPVGCRAMLTDLTVLDPDGTADVVAIPCPVARPTPIDAEPLPILPVRSHALVGVGRAVRSAYREVRYRPLAAVLARRMFDRKPAPSGGDAALRSRLAEFRSVRPLIPVPRVCLHDCLALIDWLGPAGAGVQLVFGVSAFPFAAHCWVQAEGAVLDDHPDSPSRFEPILHFP